MRLPVLDPTLAPELRLLQLLEDSARYCNPDYCYERGKKHGLDIAAELLRTVFRLDGPEDEP